MAIGKTSALVGIRGQKELTGQLERLAGSVRGSEVVDVLVGAAMLIADDARRRVPVRTGLLKSAIFVSARNPFHDARGPSVLIGVNSKKAPHAHLIELGTKHMGAKPYFRPAREAQKKPAAKKVESGLLKIIKRETR